MIKLKIAIVEDDESDFLRLKEQIVKYCDKKEIKYETIHFSCGSDFLNANNNEYSIIFLDIEIGDYDGLTIARKIRETNNVSSIIFITNLAKYAQFGYEVDAISYLIKPVNYDSFSLVFEKAMNVYSEKEEKDLIFKIPAGVEMTSINKLMYVEIISHIIIYHLLDGTIERAGSLSKVEKELSQHGFIRCHHAFIINPMFVKGIDKNDIIVGSKRIPLARSKRKHVLEELSSYYLKKN